MIKVNALGSSLVRARLSPLTMTFLFIVASLVSLFGPMVSNAAAAMVWESVPVTAGNPDHGGFEANGFYFMNTSGNGVNLSQYTKLRLDYSYTNVGMGATQLTHAWRDANYSQPTVTLPGTQAVAVDNDTHNASVEFSTGAFQSIMLWISHGTGTTGGWSSTPPNPLPPAYIAISNVKLYGQKDDGTVAVPAAPILTSPANGATIGYFATQDSSALFLFNKAADVAITQIQVSGDFETVANGTVANRTLNGGSYGSSQTLTYFASGSSVYNWVPGNTYTWRARASFSDISYAADAGWGPWSETRSFTVAGVPVTPQPPVAPILVSPIDSVDLYTQYPRLVWQYMSDVEEYTIELAEGDEFTDVVWSATHNVSLSTGTEDHFHTITGFPFENDTTYYWRVKASNEHGESGWSAVRSFTIRALSAPNAPVQLAPADGSIVSTSAPIFSWTTVEGAATYRLVVLPSEPEAASYWECFTTATTCSSLTPQAGAEATLTTGNSYYWYVEAHRSTEPNTDDPEGEYWASSPEDWMVTIAELIPDEEGGRGETGSSTTTTTTTTTTTVVTTSQTIPDGWYDYYAVADDTGKKEGTDVDTSSTETDPIDEIDENEINKRPFLLLGWWWLAIIAIFGTGAYLFFREPSEEE